MRNTIISKTVTKMFCVCSVAEVLRKRMTVLRKILLRARAKVALLSC